ncbi:hypothetical protein E4U53_006906 [Claviceps sorghi]|nr:hypothetical protein E4U53_006906 [Claviceps sorghi]
MSCKSGKLAASFSMERSLLAVKTASLLRLPIVAFDYNEAPRAISFHIAAARSDSHSHSCRRVFVFAFDSLIVSNLKFFEPVRPPVYEIGPESGSFVALRASVFSFCGLPPPTPPPIPMLRTL